MTTKFPQRFGIFTISLTLGIWLICANCSLAQDIRVFAAASLKTALDDVSDDYFEATGQRIVASYGGSSSLARQISFGAPADVFISANSLWMDELEAADVLETQSRRNLLSNRLVLIASRNENALTDLMALPSRLEGKRLAMAQVNAVPAGLYGKSALEYFGLWSRLSERVVQTDSVRAALTLVATGAASYGVVYATDAAADQRVKIAYSFPEESHPLITYPMAGVRGHLSSNVVNFLTYLASEPAMNRFREQGFIPLSDTL